MTSENTDKTVRDILKAANAAISDAQPAPDTEKQDRLASLNDYTSAEYIESQRQDFRLQLAEHLQPQLVYMDSTHPASVFLCQKDIYHGPYLDSGDAELARNAASPPSEVKALSGLCTHAFNGGAMTFMNTPSFTSLRMQFGIKITEQSSFSDEQIGNAVGLAREAHLINDLIKAKPTVEQALEVLYPLEWPKFKQSYDGGGKNEPR